MILFHTTSAAASLQNIETSRLELRTGRHPAFIRIVLEGSDNIISKGTVTRQGENILVRFPGAAFTVHGKTALLTYKQDKETIMFSPGNFQKFRSFRLKNPDRIIIDTYVRQSPPKKKHQAKKSTPVKETPVEIKTKDPKPVIETAEKHAGRKNKAPAEKPAQDNNAHSLTAGKYEKILDLIQSGSPDLAQRKLSEYQSNDAGSLSEQHFLYGEADDVKKNYMSAINHFTLAAIYADNDELRERSFLKRAGIYLKLGYFNEARSNYSIFIDNFPSSGHIKEAHLGMAKSLSRIRDFSGAIPHYEKAGTGAETFFGKANALQSLERVRDAEAAYAKALLIDNSYPVRSPETRYLIGENKRMRGDKEGAKISLKSIKEGPFKYRADISLGRMAMEEGDIETAVQCFRSAAGSKEREIRVKALINLSEAFSSSGKIKTAISTLEEIRDKYPYSPLYRRSVFELSRAYKKDGRLKESLALLKELGYSQAPPEGIFDEIEGIMLEASGKTGKETTEDMDLITVWSDFEPWLLDGAREQFLLQMAGQLRHEGGKQFLRLSTWLIANASEEIKGQAAVGLADFFIEMGDAETSAKYLELAKKAIEPDDTIMRIEARTYDAAGDPGAALRTLMSIRDLKKSDLDLFGNILLDINISELKDPLSVVDFYKSTVDRIGSDNEDYVRLADILYDNDRKDEALKYYGIALEKEEKDEWAMYRIGILAGLQEYELPREDGDEQAVYRIGIDGGMRKAEEMFSNLEKGDSTVSQMAKTKLREMAILKKVAEVF